MKIGMKMIIIVVQYKIGVKNAEYEKETRGSKSGGGGAIGICIKTDESFAGWSKSETIWSKFDVGGDEMRNRVRGVDLRSRVGFPINPRGVSVGRESLTDWSRLDSPLRL